MFSGFLRAPNLIAVTVFKNRVPFLLKGSAYGQLAVALIRIAFRVTKRDSLEHALLENASKNSPLAARKRCRESIKLSKEAPVKTEETKTADVLLDVASEHNPPLRNEDSLDPKLSKLEKLQFLDKIGRAHV